MSLTVLGGGACPFVRKVRLVLAEKGLEYQHEQARHPAARERIGHSSGHSNVREGSFCQIPRGMVASKGRALPCADMYASPRLGTPGHKMGW